MFTTMCLKEQQTSDNLIVEDYCFISEIFDKFSFNGVLSPISTRLSYLVVALRGGGGGGGGGVHPLP